MNIKHTFCILFYIIFIQSICGQNNDLLNLNLKNNVETLTEYYYTATVAEDQIHKERLEAYYTNQFNFDGYKTEDIRYFPDGSVDKKYIYIRDSLDRRIEQLQYSSDDRIIRKILYLYDESGNLKEDQSLTPDGTPEKKFVYIYDSEGHVTEDRSYNNENELLKRFTYQYDDNGQRVLNRRYGANGDPEREIHFVYDVYGNTSEEIIHFPDGKITKNRFEYNYDIYGNWTRKIIFTSEKPFQIIEREIKYY